jgi:ferredoxin--NADP+ reductase
MTHSATIVRRRDFTSDLFVLWLQPHVPFRFEAGQYITIGMGGIERPYSIVSAPYEPLLELFIERVPPDQGGMLTPLLHATHSGDIVTIRPTAKGRFTLRANATHHVMVATVTGIAPYVSMIRQFLRGSPRGICEREGCRFLVIHGASYQDEFVYDRELRTLRDEHRDVIDYVASVSRPSAARNQGWRGAVGRVNEILNDYLSQWSPPKQGSVIYLCGNPNMIEAAKRRVVPQGWSVAEEQYWAQPNHPTSLPGNRTHL